MEGTTSSSSLSPKAATQQGLIFVSYSHKDRSYVNGLIKRLRRAGLNVWADGDIGGGAAWRATIEAKIETCAAFVVVMSLSARDSRWVGIEVEHAATTERQIVPLLLSGKVFLELNHVQYEDIRDGKLPRQSFVDRLVALAAQPSPRPVAALAWPDLSAELISTVPIPPRAEDGGSDPARDLDPGTVAQSGHRRRIRLVELATALAALVTATIGLYVQLAPRPHEVAIGPQTPRLSIAPTPSTSASLALTTAGPPGISVAPVPVPVQPIPDGAPRYSTTTTTAPASRPPPPPPIGPHIVIAPDHGSPSAQIHVIGDGWKPQRQINIWVDNQYYGFNPGNTDASGHFDTLFIPSNSGAPGGVIGPGQHQLAGQTGGNEFGEEVSPAVTFSVDS
jgi:hypothetical protein